MSLRTFYRRMEDQGTKPGEFLREIRLKQARSLLEENEGMQVAEVAKRVGYSEAHLRRLLDEGPDA
jgi:transcriptional regulator GlxA family with amidase domain